MKSIDEILKRTEWGIYDKTTCPDGFNNSDLADAVVWMEKARDTLRGFDWILEALDGESEEDLILTAVELQKLWRMRKVGKLLERIVVKARARRNSWVGL